MDLKSAKQSVIDRYLQILFGPSQKLISTAPSKRIVNPKISYEITASIEANKIRQNWLFSKATT